MMMRNKPNTVSPSPWQKSMLATWVVATGFLSAIPTIVGANEIPCKYSVRDVGFVNVQNAAWQFYVLKDSNLPDEQASAFRELVDEILDDRTVDCVVLQNDSPLAKELVASVTENLAKTDEQSGSIARESETVAGVRVLLRQTRFSPDEAKTTLADLGRFSSVDALRTTLTTWVSDSLRESILRIAAERLCAVVLVEGEDPDWNAQMSQALELAMEQIQQQMWTYDKPVQQGPLLVRVTTEHQQEHPRLRVGLQTPDKGGLVGVIFGQGRVMGQWLSPTDGDSQALVDAIKKMAAICGRDCECDLDRNWLYGSQILHRWSDDLELSAEATLNFDPHSAYVRAEVSQILQKVGSRLTKPGHLPATVGGLVIHDLNFGDDSDSSGATSEAEMLGDVPATEVASADSGGDDRLAVGLKNADPKQKISKSIPSGDEEVNNTNLDSESPGTVPIPWYILAPVLILLAVMGFRAVLKQRLS